MDCVIKISAGPDSGQEFALSTGETIVGRSPRCIIRLTSPSASYEHSVISRAGDDFFIENLSANGTFLNNDRVTVKTRLRAKDQIRIGNETILRVESVPVSAAASSKRPLLIAAVVIMLLVFLAVAALNPFANKDNAADAAPVYAALQTYVDNHNDSPASKPGGKLPREAAAMLREAWLHAQSGNHKESATRFEALYMLLERTDTSHHCFTDAQNDFNNHKITILKRMLNPDPKAPPVEEDEFGAALPEFADFMKTRQLALAAPE